MVFVGYSIVDMGSVVERPVVPRSSRFQVLCFNGVAAGHSSQKVKVGRWPFS